MPIETLKPQRKWRVASWMAWLSFLAIVYVAIVTHGTFQIFQNEPLSGTYNSMLAHFKAGNFDVDPGAVGFEAFYVGDRVTTYQGPFLAFLRLGFPLLFPYVSSDWARISCVLAALLTSFFLGLCVFKVCPTKQESSHYLQGITILLCVAFALGSPIVILLSCAYIYHEPILWGMAWTAIYIWSFLHVTRKEFSLYWLMGMGAAAGLAILTRASFGGALLITQALVSVWILWNDGNRRRAFGKVALANSLCALLVVLCLYINYGRWGNALSFMPVQYNNGFLKNDHHTLNGRGRHLQRVGEINIRRIPYGLEYYFFPSPTVFFARRPYLHFGTLDLNLDPLSGIYDYIEETRMPFPVHTPLIFAFGCLGLLLCFYRKVESVDRLLLYGALTQAVLLLALSAVALRYQLDFLPLFTVGTLFALRWLSKVFSAQKIITQRIALTVCAVLTLWSVYATSSTMLLTKIWCWGVPVPAKQEIALRIFLWGRPG